MSLDVKILGLDQKSSVDFNDGSVTQANFLQIELPTGEVVLALVDDAAAQKILVAVQAARKVFREQPAPATPSVAQVAYVPAPRQAPAPPAFEFGGDGEQGAPFEDEEDEPVVPPNFGPQLKRVRLPDADEKGNPIDADGTLLADKAHQEQEPEQDLDEDGVRGL